VKAEAASPPGGWAERYFQLARHGTTPRTEWVAGLTTFVTMAYILFVNPAIMAAAGLDHDALVIATIFAAVIPIVAMALCARLPWALAPGMGYNALFAYTVVGQYHIPPRTALALVFLDGLAFLLIALLPWREQFFIGIPRSIKFGAAAGIGLFIAFIGLANAGLVQFEVPGGVTLGPGRHPVSGATGLPALGSFNQPAALIGAAGVLLTGLLQAKKVRGGLLLGVLGTTLLAWGAAWLLPGTSEALEVQFPRGIQSLVAAPDLARWARLGLARFSLAGLTAVPLGTLILVFVTFLVTDIMDSFGSFGGLASRLQILDATGNFPRSGPALVVDAAAGMWGPLVGTATVVTYIESAAGVGEGGRTGLTALVTALCFLLALFFVPLVGLIPPVATAPALILVGLSMMEPVLHIDWQDVTEGLPAFLALLLMPLTYSIASGMLAGIVSYLVLKSLSGRAREIAWSMWLFGALLLAGKVLEVTAR
jgi:AGZA family xanthine/uracil permease-like MFS transporter